MSEFRYSGGDVRKLDIRHMYSGSSCFTIRLPLPVDKDGLRHLERITPQISDPTVPKISAGKYIEFNRKYKVVLPRAPAFRRFSKTEVKEIVSRLHKMRGSQAPAEKSDDVTKNSQNSPASATRSKHASGNKDTSKQRNSLNSVEINARLYPGKTASASLRQREKVVVAHRNQTRALKSQKVRRRN